jgi:hypothetical protein
MEVVVHGTSMTDAAFALGLHAALRALIDGLGVRTFNAAIHNVVLPGGEQPQEGGGGGAEGQGPPQPVVARCAGLAAVL